MKFFLVCLFVVIVSPIFVFASEPPKTHSWTAQIQTVFDSTKPLPFPRGNRLPLYLWPVVDPGTLDNETAEYLVQELDKRGIGVICSWLKADYDGSLSRGMPIARAQKKLGLMVNINATDLLYSFFNGDERTAHIDTNGKPFWDTSFGAQKMGCPFTLDIRKDDIRKRIEYYAKAYQDSGIHVDFIFADWEIDGPLEVNHAHATSKNCARCCENIRNIDDFKVFQKIMKTMRSYLQYYSYTSPLLTHFPDILVGNYAVYPNDGYRYWYDYFEYYVDGQPYKADQRAKYREWFNDFPLTGYTYAMPVIYPWYSIYEWYDFKNIDYRWFYNMLLNASNVGKSTPRTIPIIAFVHWHIIDPPKDIDPNKIQLSEKNYQELLWHMLLRGTDTFFMWCPSNENQIEVKLVHEVYAEAQEFGDFLERGIPITFDVPAKAGTVISGLAMGDKVLVRRTDFDDSTEPVEILAGTKVVKVPPLSGKCQILSLK